MKNTCGQNIATKFQTIDYRIDREILIFFVHFIWNESNSLADHILQNVHRKFRLSSDYLRLFDTFQFFSIYFLTWNFAIMELIQCPKWHHFQFLNNFFCKTRKTTKSVMIYPSLFVQKIYALFYANYFGAIWNE